MIKTAIEMIAERAAEGREGLLGAAEGAQVGSEQQSTPADVSDPTDDLRLTPGGSLDVFQQRPQPAFFLRHAGELRFLSVSGGKGLAHLPRLLLAPGFRAWFWGSCSPRLDPLADGGDGPGAGRHHHHAVSQEYRFRDGMGDE